MIVTDNRVALFVGEQIGAVIYPPFTCMGIERGGKIVAGVIFNCFTAHDVEVTVAGKYFPRWFIREVGNYVFGTMGKLRMSITTEQPEVINYAHRLSAQTEGHKRNHFGEGRDATLLGILKEEWKL